MLLSILQPGFTQNQFDTWKNGGFRLKLRFIYPLKSKGILIEGLIEISPRREGLAVPDFTL